MVNCPYLTYDPSHCAACTGWFCVVFGQKKRLTDTAMCVNKEDWLTCTRYTKKIGTAKEPEPEPEEEIIELPPTEEVTSITGVDMETIKVSVEPEPTPTVKLTGIGVLSPPGTSRKTVKRPAARPLPRDDCPYLGPVPAGKVACCGFWCHANDSPIRTTTACTSPPTWRECRLYVKASRRGVN